MCDYCKRNNYVYFKANKLSTNRNCLPTFGTTSPLCDKNFRPRVLLKLFILNRAPYNICIYVVSIYFLSNCEFEFKYFKQPEKFYCDFTEEVILERNEKFFDAFVAVQKQFIRLNVDNFAGGLYNFVR